MELTQGKMEEKDLRIIQHPGHDHPLVLRESLQGANGNGGGGLRVKCDGCREPISSSSSGGSFYVCPNSDCWFLLHKRCAELPPKIEPPCHPEHALTLSHFPLDYHRCDVCDSVLDGFLYRCSDCEFDVHVRCASMAVHIQDRVDENHKIHQHPLISIEMEAQFLCAACGREHKGKSYLCHTCGFWAHQICASAPTTVDICLHPHPLTLSCSYEYMREDCKICKKEVKRAYWFYCCSGECKYSVHVGCWLSLEEAENSNRDIQTNLDSESTSHKIDIPRDLKNDIILNKWPVPESAELMTQLIKNLSLQKTHKRGTKILRCKRDHPLDFVYKKIDEFKDDQLCDGCAQTISSQFYHCTQCNFSLHEWCAELPNELQHILHPKCPLRLLTQQHDMYFRHTYCHCCYMQTNGFVFCCIPCGFVLDLKCASLPRLIKHQVDDHYLALRRVIGTHSCNGRGLNCFGILDYCFQCEACNFRLCITCALLPFSVRHRYDKHPFVLTYSPIKGQLDEYYCEICEKDIDSKHWFYHCIECDQSLHPKCIYPIERYLNIKFGARMEVNFHSHLLSCVRRPKAGVKPQCSCPHSCDSGKFDNMAYECEQCDFWMHFSCFTRYILKLNSLLQ